ncbi:hypothetical protein ACFQPG_07015 [Sphingomonas sp. GCM10030256]|uniref:hypothetical protein n=1 Tax=Sphingomonas sp. GCM10030256 TaxID=3273427 RepID=UPI0036221B3E
MTLLFAFLVSLLSTLAVGAVAKVFLELFAPLHPSRFGAFCVALGFAASRANYKGPADWNALLAFSTMVGSVLALWTLGRWLVRNTPREEGGYHFTRLQSPTFA